MAYSGELTKRDLLRVAKLLSAIRAETKMSEIRAEPAFRAGADVFELLNDVANDVKEQLPQVAEWGAWGPAYFKWREDDQDTHYFAFRLKKSGWKSWCGAGFLMSGQRVNQVKWVTHYKLRQSHELEEEWYGLSRIIGPRGIVRRDVLSSVFMQDLKRSGILGKRYSS